MSSRDARARWDIADVLARIDLDVLLDELAQPSTLRHGPGRRWHCPAPDHDDQRASVTMHRDRHGHERWRCWSADHRGDAIDLVMLTTGRERAEAIEWLAARAGLHPDRPLPPVVKRRPVDAPALTPSPFVQQYVNACHRILRLDAGRPVADWLQSRGFDWETITANRLGADPGRRMMNRTRGLPAGAGLAAVFPALDPAGQVSYVQARYLEVDTVGRKYDNPAATLAPHPRLAFPAVRGERGGVLLVCEGLPDALTAAQAGFRSVALLGARTPDEAVAARLANHAGAHGLDVAIITDPDPAGRYATATLTALLDRIGVEPAVITPPDGCDVNAWALRDPRWAEVVDAHLGAAAVDLSVESMFVHEVEHDQ